MALDITEPPARRHRHRRLRSGSESIRRLRNLLASDVGGQAQDPPPHRLRSRWNRLLDDCLWPHHRPSSSPVRCPPPISSDESWPSVSKTMTKPKYFSTPERLGFVDGSGLSQHKRSASLPTSPVQSRPLPVIRSGFSLLGRDQSTHRRVVSNETCHKTGKRHCGAVTPNLPQLDRPAAVGMQTSADQKPGLSGTAESMYDSFRWLEEDDELDLRLYLDDYHLNLREEVLAPTKSHQSGRPSFRRHLSISKLPFGGRVSGTFSRPSTKDEGSPISPTSPVFGNSGHVRRRSRALSLMTPRQASAEIPTTIDPAASHYQDPEARMKLRVYLASPHKFDEAIVFGFPSIEEVHGQESQESCKHMRATSRQESPRPQTFLEDDASSVYSEESMADPESPKTPGAADKPLPIRPVRVSQDTGSGSKLDYASSREMTLRMTLTRPDLRSHEEQMYGWQKGSTGRRSHTRDEPLPKGSIEQQLAAIDQEELAAAGDGSAVKRFWNRVRRS
ncbi:hypothetical protein CP533_5817 [Ophiocordyceps camponoti-saundersi (nom. inval.)]|nr:hypothetical protein CP533_5817 [Ophiocordyceps camponoti-saundersi (nom. inval.)]